MAVGGEKLLYVQNLNDKKTSMGNLLLQGWEGMGGRDIYHGHSETIRRPKTPENS